MTVTIPASEVERGHSIPGLDDGYVVLAESYIHEVRFVFHTAKGEEAYLTCPHDMPITVDQKEPCWVGDYW